jgi:hypothetical protein
LQSLGEKQWGLSICCRWEKGPSSEKPRESWEVWEELMRRRGGAKGCSREEGREREGRAREGRGARQASLLLSDLVLS